MEYVEHKAVWFPEPSRVAGSRLMPPTIGQIRLLEACSSPFLCGGPADALDVAIAIRILRTPWRAGRRLLARPRLFALAAHVDLLLRPALRRPGSADEVAAWITRWLWTPEMYVKDNAGSAFEPACGFTCRLALRAAKLPLAALCHDRPGAWGCVWDVPVDAALLWCVAATEAAGEEFQNRAECDSLAQTQKLDAAEHADHDAGGENHSLRNQERDIDEIAHGNSITPASESVNGEDAHV
jgi:hypothetical protein